jgi:PKD repeat protein
LNATLCIDLLSIFKTSPLINQTAMKKVTYLILVLLFSGIRIVFPQDTLILQPGPEGKDATLWSIHPDNSFGEDQTFKVMGWTFYGTPGKVRSLIDFDLSDIPPGGEIIDARLNLYYLCIQPTYIPQTGENESWLQLITEEWDEGSPTWNDPPQTTTEDQVYLPTSTEPEQDYTNIDVTIPIRKMYNEPENYHGLMLRLVNEEYYRCLLFASGDYLENPELRPKLEIIYISCEPPTVDFDYQVNGDTVSYTGTSPSATSWHWDFGDGDTSNIQNPDHIYLQQGTYQVCLRVDDTCYFAEHCDMVSICDMILPESAFIYLIDNLTVTFQDASIMADEYYWDFGDGYYSNLSNPLHIYDYPGQYEVCLTTWNACGSDTSCQMIELCMPSSEFSFEIDGLNVYFQNESTLADGYYWDFGDGYFSDLEDPWHAYEDNLNYLVCLMTWNECGSDTNCEMIELTTTLIPESGEVLAELYPNPARDMVFIKPFAEGELMISMADLSGKEVLLKNFNVALDETIKIPVDRIEPGLYILRFDSGKNQSFCKLVIAR